MTPQLPPAEEAPRLAQVGLWFLLAGMGGAVKFLAAALRGREAVSNRRFLALLAANVFISSFSGILGTLLVSTVTQQWEWHAIAAGVFGYPGTTGLDLAVLALRQKVEPAVPLSSVIPIPPSVDSPANG